MANEEKDERLEKHLEGKDNILYFGELTKEVWSMVMPTFIHFENRMKQFYAQKALDPLAEAIAKVELAQKLKYKKDLLKEAQAHIEVSKFFLKELHNNKVFSVKFFRQIDFKLTLASKSIGSYLKKINSKK